MCLALSSIDGIVSYGPWGWSALGMEEVYPSRWPPKPRVVNSWEAKKWRVRSVLFNAFARFRDWATQEQTSRHFGAYRLAQRDYWAQREESGRHFWWYREQTGCSYDWYQENVVPGTMPDDWWPDNDAGVVRLASIEGVRGVFIFVCITSIV